jgi:tRNA-splicing ligase RtcB
MLHSGSRNLGYKVAAHYEKIAKEKFCGPLGIPPFWDLACLPLDSEEGHDYFAEMTYCMAFADANRELMMERIKEAVIQHVPGTTFSEDLSIGHNFAALETHFGQPVMLHRKGATSARLGELGIIPGSQGTKSFIVRGLGNPDSFTSCSHGAGRTMSRSKAKKTLVLADEIRKMDEMGIIHGIRGVGDLDEASSAYKDIDSVMANQMDLVEIVTELHPIAVIKG